MRERRGQGPAPYLPPVKVTPDAAVYPPPGTAGELLELWPIIAGFLQRQLHYGPGILSDITETGNDIGEIERAAGILAGYARAEYARRGKLPACFQAPPAGTTLYESARLQLWLADAATWELQLTHKRGAFSVPILPGDADGLGAMLRVAGAAWRHKQQGGADG